MPSATAKLIAATSPTCSVCAGESDERSNSRSNGNNRARHAAKNALLTTVCGHVWLKLKPISASTPRRAVMPTYLEVDRASSAWNRRATTTKAILLNMLIQYGIRCSGTPPAFKISGMRRLAATNQDVVSSAINNNMK